MNPNKKKPRIRNRPRNKANRQKLLESHSDGDPTTHGIAEEVKSERDVNDTSGSEDDMPDLEDEADTKTSQLLYVPEEDEAINAIQRFMREKIFKQQQMCTETDTTVTSVTSAQAEETDKVVKPKANAQTLNADSLTYAIEDHTVVKPLSGRQTIEADAEAKPKENVQTLVADILTSAQAIEVDTAAKPVASAQTEETGTAVKPLALPQTVEPDTVTKPVESVQSLEADALISAQAAEADTTAKPIASAQTVETVTAVKPQPLSQTAEVDTAAEPVSSVQSSEADACAKAVTSAQAVEADTATKRSMPKQSAESRKDTKSNSSLNLKSAKTKGKPVDNNPEQNAFIQNIQKKMEAMMANGDENLPNTLMENLKKLFDQGPVSDVESDGDEEEYVEYIYKPRKYFMVPLCNLCKCDLCKLTQMTECSKCHMTYYCSVDHMQNDAEHLQLCCALQQVAAAEDGQIFQKCVDMSADQFRSYRIITIRKVEMLLNRPLSATEQEVILFPRLCMNTKCRQNDFNALQDCPKCGMVAFCTQQPQHLMEDHQKWCGSYQLFKEFVIFQEEFGKLDPSLPTKILKDTPLNCNTTKQIFCKLGFDLPLNCEYAALTQIATAPLTAWYALKLCEQLKLHQDLTIHLIGAEIEFEVDVLHKWELFFLHITPTVKNLNVVFVGPELNPNNILLEQFQRTKCCIGCRKNSRTVKYFFESSIYHDYCRSEDFLKPNLICFFNAGLYRTTGYNMEDTWPETIAAASNLHVPIVVTAYTEYESPLDMQRFVEECQRDLKTVQTPTENPFASVKPERNFISDNEAPLMFKNFFCFVVE